MGTSPSPLGEGQVLPDQPGKSSIIVVDRMPSGVIPGTIYQVVILIGLVCGANIASCR